MTKDLNRKNLIRVSLTNKGKRLCDSANEVISHHTVMSALPEQDREQMISYLLTIRNSALKELGINNKPPFPY